MTDVVVRWFNYIMDVVVVGLTLAAAAVIYLAIPAVIIFAALVIM